MVAPLVEIAVKRVSVPGLHAVLGALPAYATVAVRGGTLIIYAG